MSKDVGARPHRLSTCDHPDPAHFAFSAPLHDRTQAVFRLGAPGLAEAGTPGIRDRRQPESLVGSSAMIGQFWRWVVRSRQCDPFRTRQKHGQERRRHKSYEHRHWMIVAALAQCDAREMTIPTWGPEWPVEFWSLRFAHCCRCLCCSLPLRQHSHRLFQADVKYLTLMYPP